MIRVASRFYREDAMEIQLQELLQRIQSEGVQAATTKAEALIAEAESKAASMVADAEREAKSLRDGAKADAARMLDAGNAALAQAARDTILSFKDRISSILRDAVMAEAASRIDESVLAQVMPEVVARCLRPEDGDVTLLLAPATVEKLDAGFAARLASILGKGVEIHPVSGITAGFRISSRGGALVYDFNADAVAELLARRLNARLASTVRSAVAKG